MTGNARARARIVDTLCNAFTPDRLAVWDGALAATGIAGEGAPQSRRQLRRARGVRRADGRARHRHRACSPPATSAATARSTRTTSSTSRRAGRRSRSSSGGGPVASPRSRSIDPRARDARRAASMRAHLADPWVVGCYLHTHSFDRRLDHADYYPFYAACADAGVPVADAGGHVGRADGERVRAPDHASTAPRSTSATRTFVLSHLGVPWVDEAVALALKFPNVYLGTGALPAAALAAGGACSSCAGPGRTKVLFAQQLPDRRSPPRARPGRASSSSTPEIEQALARRHRPYGVHPPRGTESRAERPMIGKVYGIPPQPPVEENTRHFPAGAVTLRRGVPRPRPREPRVETYKDNPEYLAELREKSPEGGFTDEGVTHPRVRRERRARVPALRRVRRRAALPLHPPHRRRHRRQQRDRLRRRRGRRHARVDVRAAAHPARRRCSSRPAAPTSPSVSMPRSSTACSTTSRRCSVEARVRCDARLTADRRHVDGAVDLGAEQARERAEVEPQQHDDDRRRAIRTSCCTARSSRCRTRTPPMRRATRASPRPCRA